MDAEEMKALLPLYAAGSLPEEDRVRMDNALGSSPELQDELAFWRQVQVAVRLDADGRLAGHPSGEVLLAYLEHTLPDPAALPRLEEHIRRCASCRKELEFLRDSSPGALERHPPRVTANATGVQEFLARLREFVVRRPVSVAGGALAVILAVALVVLRPPREEAPPMQAVAEAPATEPQWTNLTLVYRPAMRGEAQTEALAELQLDSSSAGARIMVILPASADSTRYLVRLGSGGGEISRDARPTRYGGEDDTLLLDVARERLSVPGAYTLEVEEILPSALVREGLTPNVYILPFTVRLRRM